MASRKPIVIVGAGFTGLTCAYALSKTGAAVEVYESEEDIGGLAGSFRIGDVSLEKFYHHWFLTDDFVLDLVKELRLSDSVVERKTRTGMYFAQQFYRLSTPLDVLRFAPLSAWARIRLGVGTLWGRLDLHRNSVEHVTARDWLIGIYGREVYGIVWEPLLIGKFGPYAEKIGAAWFWKKLVLRGGTRNHAGAETLAYLRGGFARLADRLAVAIEAHGGRIRTSTPVLRVLGSRSELTGVETSAGRTAASAIVITTAPAIAARLARDVLSDDEIKCLQRIKYLGNLCLVLRLDRSLSQTYWLNVNDPSFPFVGIIEHTNFESAESYRGDHVVYLSRYTPADDTLFQADDAEVLAHALPHIQRMFPEFRENWIRGYSVWKAEFAQPIAVPGYRALIPPRATSIPGLFLANMAQIYPEDRGTNYAVREGLRAAEAVRAYAESMSATTISPASSFSNC